MNVDDGPDAMVEITRSNEIGNPDASVYLRLSTVKMPLACGDLILCYDFRTINLSGTDETIDAGNLEVVIVRKTAGVGKRGARSWVLKTLIKHNDDKDENVNNKFGGDDAVEDFKRELEDDPEMRKEINLYRKPDFTGMDTDDNPVVDLSELLEALNLNEKEDTL
jgi:nonsense-mediated mRNA decay protein 3